MSTVRLIALAAGLFAGLAAPALALDSIIVQTDRAQVLKLPPRATTIVIGNPMIADVSIQKNGSMVVTGKSYGTTNLIAQDPTGAVIGESLIKVEAANDGTLVVQRGLERETYSCTPQQCQPTLSLGDVQKQFEMVGNQTNARNGLAK
jgi:hypothetical protein